MPGVEGAKPLCGGALVVEARRARQSFKNCGQVSPFVVPFALAACHCAPHCFMTLWAFTGDPSAMSPRAKRAAEPNLANEFPI